MLYNFFNLVVLGIFNSLFYYFFYLNKFIKYANYPGSSRCNHRKVFETAYGHMNLFPKTDDVGSSPLHNFLQLSETSFCIGFLKVAAVYHCPIFCRFQESPKVAAVYHCPIFCRFQKSPLFILLQVSSGNSFAIGLVTF
jgi:hypothetical protein